MQLAKRDAAELILGSRGAQDSGARPIDGTQTRDGGGRGQEESPKRRQLLEDARLLTTTLSGGPLELTSWGGDNRLTHPIRKRRIGLHDRSISAIESDLIRTKSDLKRAHELICEASEHHSSLDNDHEITRAIANRLDSGHKSMGSLLADQQRLHEDLEGRCRQVQQGLSETNTAHISINDRLQELRTWMPPQGRSMGMSWEVDQRGPPASRPMSVPSPRVAPTCCRN